MGIQSVSEQKWARQYETIYILRPNIDEAAAQKVVDRAKDVIDRLDGKLIKLDNWGKRRLAYPIQKHYRGQFVCLNFAGYNDLCAELERNLNLFEEVIRFQTIMLEDQVDLASVVVDSEEVKYLHIEDETEEESLEVVRARSLGMTRAVPDREPSETLEVESTGENIEKPEGGVVQEQAELSGEESVGTTQPETEENKTVETVEADNEVNLKGTKDV